MANLLSDIGRSNLFQVGQTLFRDAALMDTQQKEWANRDRLVRIQEQEEARKQAAFQQQQQVDNIEWGLEDFGLSPDTEAGKTIAEVVKKSNLGSVNPITGRVTVKNSVLPMVKQYVLAKPEAALAIAKAHVIDLYNEETKLNSKIEKETDPVELEKLLIQKGNLKQTAAQQTARYNQLVEAMQGKEDKLTIVPEGASVIDRSGKEVFKGKEKQRGRMIPVYDPSSPTEYSYGNPETGDLTDMAAPPPRSAAEKSDPFNVWLTSYIEANGRKPSAQEVMDWHRASAVNINLNKETAIEAIKTLPELKTKAESSTNAITRIDTMLRLIAKGAGGRFGQAKAWVAPMLEAVGYKSQGLAEAQMYETLAKTLGGSMRVEIVGPGVVSDYEQKLLEKVSAGGSTATDAAKELLQYYKGVAEKNIKSYNQAVAGVSVEAPNAPRIFPPVQPNAPAQNQIIRYDSKGNRIP